MSAGMYMASLGGSGFRKLARLNFEKAAYLQAELVKAGAAILFESPVFNEFAVKFSFDFEPVRKKLFEEEKTVAGLGLGKYYKQFENTYLFCATETLSKEDIDRIVAAVKRYSKEAN